MFYLLDWGDWYERGSEQVNELLQTIGRRFRGILSPDRKKMRRTVCAQIGGGNVGALDAAAVDVLEAGGSTWRRASL